MIKLGLLLSTGALLGAGCTVEVAGPPTATVVAAAPSEVYVGGPPPAPIVEVVPAMPGPAFVWINGCWVWGGSHWRWETGRWARPPHPGARWVAHQYVYRNGRHVFVQGGWR